MIFWLAPAHLALTIIILIWDIILAGRIAQRRQAPPAFQAITGMAAMLLLPAVLLALATSTIITGRAVVLMDWVWPAVLVLFAVQATYAVSRRLVNPFWGIPIAVYNIVIATIGVVRYFVAHGYTPPTALVTLMAAQSTALVLSTGTAAAVATPFYFNMPMVSPAFPALRSLTAGLRFVMAVVAGGWVVLIATIGLPRADKTARTVREHANDRLRERPDADFAIGLKVLPDVAGAPSPAAIRNDLALADSLETDVLSVVVVPDATRGAIDSLGRVLEPAQRDTTPIIVALGYRGKLVPELGHVPLNIPERLGAVDRVMRRIHPTILLPAEDPYGSGARVLGRLPVETWKSYITQAARAAKAIDPKVQIGVSIASFSSRDSALYAWAGSPGSPVDIVGFSFFGSPFLGEELDALERAADRWMRVTPTRKPIWVFATGGYPLAYGEQSQERAIWQVLSWATDHPAIKGLIVYEAGDYGQARGLRAPNGRMRSASTAVLRAIRGLRESAR